MTEPILVVEHLTHQYGARIALDDVTLQVCEGEIFALLGPNGGGKTTLFRILATLMRPTSGCVRLFGDDALAHPERVRRHLGIVFQSPSVDGKLTVRENLRHQGHLYDLWGANLRRRIEALLERFDLRDRADEPVERLSGGLRRRVEIAKALLHDPPLLLLDEPTAGLDVRARLELWSYLRTLREQRSLTIVFTTHYLEEGEQCDRVAILDRGRLVALEDPETLKAEIGGDVIFVEGRELESLCAEIRARWGIEATLVDGKLCFRHERGHEFLARLVEAFPGRIVSLMVRRPTLEDVFIHRTGHRFEEGAHLR
ncbi:MAG: ABC transporter ATP-binding protein [Blastocatellia bacterium]|nr:ABC transporter ATP-binding protein [Blastocatellia bacterium]MCX7751935.1 ABC transporter ATP-binding protein [Blastocatellia bacterium]MDW8167041.1 ATP-binding cassette domain-containing protein [Acidobacteriota bacterium]